MTRQEAFERLRAYFIKNEKDNGGTKENCDCFLSYTEGDLLAKLNDWFDSDPPNIDGEFVIDILAKEK